MFFVTIEMDWSGKLPKWSQIRRRVPELQEERKREISLARWVNRIFSFFKETKSLEIFMKEIGSKIAKVAMGKLVLKMEIPMKETSS